MSSSDKFPDWSVFKEREVPVEVEILSPASEMVVLLQNRLADMQKTQRAIDEVQTKRQEELAQQAVYVTQLTTTLERHKAKLEEAKLVKLYRALSIAKDQMLTALQEAGLEVIVPLGKPFNEVAEYVEVLGWRHHDDFTSEVVAEVMEPIVLSHESVIRQGCIIIGAPLEH